MRKTGRCVPVIIFIFLQTLFFRSTGYGNAGHSESLPAFITPAGKISCAHDTVPVADTFNFYVSNKGSNLNNGMSSSSPKPTIESVGSLINLYAMQHSQAALGLDAGSKFREQLDAKNNNIKVSSFGMQPGKVTALISGMDVVSDWHATQGKSNMYESSISHTVEFATSNYNYLLVAEIDTLQEKLYPVSAVKYLRFVSTADQCESLPGTFFMPALTQNPIPVYIHATEGIPGKNRYRYEVVRRPYNINAFTSDNSTYENLFLQSAGNGVGMLAAGENTVVRNVVFQGGGTHHAVIYSGVVGNSLFLPGAKGLADEIGLVFYKPEGTGSRNKISNAVFLDIKNAIFTHTNGASNYHSLSIDSVVAFADTLYTTTMLSCTNTDSIIISNNYCYGYKNFWIGTPSYLSIKNTVINNVSEPAVYLGGDQEIPCNAVVSNVLIKTNSNDANQHVPPVYQPSVGFLFKQNSTSIKVSNTIFHGQSSWHTQYATETVFDNAMTNKLEAFNNIYICEVNPENYLHVVNANNTAGKGSATNVASDYNAYILLKGTIYWSAYPNSPQGDGNIFSLKEWQSFSGQDQHSIFIDLRNNPAGLKAIFTDPENGNWTFAQTPQADSVRKINAGMLTPPLFYPRRPTYEDALDHTSLGGLSYFTGSRAARQVQLEWKTIDEPSLAYFAIESGTDKINFADIKIVAPAGRHKDSVYGYARSDSNYTRVYYRLRLVNNDSSYSYSSTIYVEPSKKDSIVNGIGGYQAGIVAYPNPAGATLTVEHPARNQARINLYDYTGKLLGTFPVQAGTSVTILPLQNLAPGRYLAAWSSGSEQKAVSFIKGR